MYFDKECFQSVQIAILTLVEFIIYGAHISMWLGRRLFSHAFSFTFWLPAFDLSTSQDI